MSLELFGNNANTHARVEVFGANGGNMATWVRRPEESMAFILCIGSGAGGGAGFTRAAGGAGGGGGGGGSGALARAIVPLFTLPDTWYVQVGLGGAGGATSAAAGTVGQRSYVSIAPNITAANLIMQSGAAAATAGNATTAPSATVVGSAGAAETISTSVLCVLSNFGIQTFLAGKAGAAAGAIGGAAGGANTLLSASQMNGGAGGGSVPAANTNFAGGAQTGAGVFPTIAGGVSGGGDIASGQYSKLLGTLIPYGGAGGGTAGASGTAGKGGDGGWPGGGGGGGGSGVTFGGGGKGGDGAVIIVSW